MNEGKLKDGIVAHRRRKRGGKGGICPHKRRQRGALPPQPRPSMLDYRYNVDAANSYVYPKLSFYKLLTQVVQC